MYLSEITDNTRLVKIVTAIDKLKTAIEQGEVKTNWDIGTLLKYFKAFNIILSADDVYNMISPNEEPGKKYPLKTVVDNIKGQEVIFKGVPQEKEPIEAPADDDNKKIVDKMAHRAGNKTKKKK